MTDTPLFALPQSLPLNVVEVQSQVVYGRVGNDIDSVINAVRTLMTGRTQCAELLLPMADSLNEPSTTARESVSKFTYRIFPCKQPLLI